MKITQQLGALSLAAGVYATLALPAFAQAGTSLNPCTNIGDPWNKLCSPTADKASGIISNVILAIFIIATVIALFFLIWGGIKWILSGGDKAKVEAARGTIIAAIVGLIITFASYFILSIVLGVFGLSINNLTLPKIIP